MSQFPIANMTPKIHIVDKTHHPLTKEKLHQNVNYFRGVREQINKQKNEHSSTGEMYCSSIT